MLRWVTLTRWTGSRRTSRREAAQSLEDSHEAAHSQKRSMPMTAVVLQGGNMFNTLSATSVVCIVFE